jgi:hypothetical protein
MVVLCKRIPDFPAGKLVKVPFYRKTSIVNPKLSLGFGCWHGRDARGPKENKAGQRWSEFKGR